MAKRIVPKASISAALVLTSALFSPVFGHAAEEKAACALSDIACNLGKVTDGVGKTVDDALEGKGIRKPGDKYEIEATGMFNGQHITCFKGDSTAYVDKPQSNTFLGSKGGISAWSGGVSALPLPCDKLIESGVLKRVNAAGQVHTGPRYVPVDCPNATPAHGETTPNGTWVCRDKLGTPKKRYNPNGGIDPNDPKAEFGPFVPEYDDPNYGINQSRRNAFSKADDELEKARKILEDNARKDEERRAAARRTDIGSQRPDPAQQMQQMIEMMQKMQAGKSGAGTPPSAIVPQ